MSHPIAAVARRRNAAQLLLPLMGLLAALLATGTASAAVEQAMVEKIDGREVESVTITKPGSNVVVVFESGLRGTLDRWDKVLDAVSPDASVFAYNRPGYANSGTTDAPRDGATIARQLRQVLNQKGLRPPYVLVGHSLGGLYMQMFARLYPHEVAGIVLVDALLPRVVKKPEDFPFTTRLAKKVFFSSTVGREVDAIYETGEQVLALPGLDNKPVIMLINAPKSATAIPVDFGAINRDPKNVAFVRTLYPNAKKVILDSDHQMHSESPEAVIKAITEMVGASSRK